MFFPTWSLRSSETVRTARGRHERPPLLLLTPEIVYRSYCGAQIKRQFFLREIYGINENPSPGNRQTDIFYPENES